MAQAQTSFEDVTNTRTTFLTSFFETIPGYERRQFIMPDDGNELTYHGITGFTRTPELIPYAVQIIATLVYTDLSRTNILAEGLPITLNYLDFAAPEGNATVSKGKSIGITIPATVNKVDGYFMTKYQVQLLPNGAWSNFMYSTEEQSVPIFASSRITGPNAICSDGVFTITNPRTVTLENASGVATLTALENNQWKVTRIGNGSGKVQLKSAVGSKVYVKDINVGTPPSVLNGPSIIRTNGLFNFSISESTIGASIEYTVMAPNGVEFTPIDDKNFTLNVTTTSTGGSTLMVRVTIKTTNSCGTSQYVKNIGIQI
ncbi:hypothetical protein B0I21_10788 [Sphingobacterium paludis]|uniref:Uncharacterized protein n=2 Tax=Sphingobacterium paludis TaxID=1476465 RepID=A0A4R7CXE2_9SPHI|nr:hypothetical protein B0I21_10788 [Sphingobacterium paludis]